MKTKRIGLIAMSGVRARNPELVAAGLTMPGFVERSEVIASLPSLSLLTLAGMTPDGFELSYHEIADLRGLDTLPMDFDLVALTSLSAQIRDAYQVAAAYRAKGIPVILGGLHATALPDEGVAQVGSVAVGEGELIWPEVLSDLDSGTLKPVYRAPRGESFDLRQAPLPRFDLLDPSRYNRLTVQTSRGCPHRCSLCASSILLTAHYKTKPVAKVMEEIKAIRALWPRPFIEFADDNSFVHRGHAKELLRALARENVPWFTEADVRVADDPELLGLMRDAGCRQVLIGLESPAKDSLDGLEEKANWKWRRRDRYLEAIDRIQSYGITVNGCFILGLDADTESAFDRVFDFVRESSLYEVQVTVLTPFPGTPLYARLKQEGRLIEETAWDACTLFDVNLRPKQMSVARLEAGMVDLIKRLYSAEETRSRRRRFWRHRKGKPGGTASPAGARTSSASAPVPA
ncbi:MAG: radical SAM protein [Verrucomicrobia bacterium]|nr:radical SAM protein [Verrucomicrobiota bacterium]